MLGRRLFYHIDIMYVIGKDVSCNPHHIDSGSSHAKIRETFCLRCAGLDDMRKYGSVCGLSHIHADFRQIMWRKFPRNLCKYSTMAQKVLPHNLAWPFLLFLPSCCRPRSTATLCGRKG